MKARFDRNPRRSGSKIARELNILQELMQHILKNELGLKPLKFQKVQELADGQKRLDWQEPRSYFAFTKVASLVFSKKTPGKSQGVTSHSRKWPVYFSPLRSHSKLSSL